MSRVYPLKCVQFVKCQLMLAMLDQCVGKIESVQNVLGLCAPRKTKAIDRFEPSSLTNELLTLQPGKLRLAGTARSLMSG